MLCFGLLLSCPLLRWARAPLLIALYSIGSLEFGRRATRPSGVKNRIGLGPDIGTNIKMQALKPSHPHLSVSVHSPRVTKTEDGFQRLQDLTDV